MPAERCRCRAFGTTADMGLSASAATLPGLFSVAGEGLASAMIDRRTVREREKRLISLATDSLPDLAVAWLNELIFLFDAERFVTRRCRVSLPRGGSLDAVVTGETFDPARHRVVTSFKAATYHRLFLARLRGRWRLRVILDV